MKDNAVIKLIRISLGESSSEDLSFFTLSLIDFNLDLNDLDAL